MPDGHLGLAGMRARAEKIGATLEVDRRRPGAGTTIEVFLPDAAIEAAADVVSGVREPSPAGNARHRRNDVGDSRTSVRTGTVSARPTLRRMTDPTAAGPIPLRVLVVDPDDRIRESITRLLPIGGRCAVVGSAGRHARAVALAASIAPDVAVIDSRLPTTSAPMGFIDRAPRRPSPASASWS